MEVSSSSAMLPNTCTETEGFQAKYTLTLNLSAKADQGELETKEGRKIIWSGSRDLKKQNNFCAEEGDKNTW